MKFIDNEKEIDKNDGGVYIISCDLTEKIYVGSTSSFRKRVVSHRSSLSLNKHENPELQQAWNKHGSLAFKFIPLKAFKTIEKSDAHEEYIIRELGLDNCFNSVISRGSFPCKESSKNLQRKAMAHQYIIKHPDGQHKTITNLKQFCKDNGLSYTYMHARPRPVHKGYQLIEKVKKS